MLQTAKSTTLKKRLEPTLRELRFILSRLKENPLSIAGIAIISFYAVLAALAPVIAPPPPKWRDPYMIPRYGFIPEPKPPNEKLIFGTTEGQYDLFYGCIWGTRTAFRIGLMVVLSVALIGLVIGSVSGYYGGLVDEVLMRLTDIILSFPGLILVMALVVALGPSLDTVMTGLILVGWPSYARLMRGEVLRVKSQDFVEAAKAVGCSDFRVIFRHIVPNAIYPMLVMASLDIGTTVLSAAALSFLGLGAPVGYADWGQLISLSRNWIIGTPGQPLKYWHTFIIPGLFIFTFVLGWNLLGDALRDVLDPMMRRR